MQISIQRPSEGLEHVMTVSIEGSGLQNAIDLRLKEIQKNVRMDGFRPGKVPMNMVRTRHGQQAFMEAMDDLLYKTFYDAARQEQLTVAGILSFSDVNRGDNDHVSYTVRFETYPEITLPDFSQMTIDKVSVNVTDADVNTMIDRLRDMRKTFEPSQSAAVKDDMVNIDFVGSIGGEKFDGGSAENVPLVLGSGRMIPGFEEGIMGMSAGEQKVIDVTFPENYQAADLAGKTAQFDIKVNSVQTPKLPEIDAEFIQAFGIKDATMESFRDDVKKTLERQVALTVSKKNKENTIDALLAVANFPVPNSLIQREAQSMLESVAARMREEGRPAPTVPASHFNDDAQNRIKIGLLFGDIMRQNNIAPDAQSIREILSIEADSYDDPENFIQWYLSDAKRRQEVEGIATENAVVDFILSQANTNSVVRSIEDLAG